MAEAHSSNKYNLRCRCESRSRSREANKSAASRKAKVKQKVESWLNENPYRRSAKDSSEGAERSLCETNNCPHKSRLRTPESKAFCPSVNTCNSPALSRLERRLQAIEDHVRETNARLKSHKVRHQCKCKKRTSQETQETQTKSTRTKLRVLVRPRTCKRKKAAQNQTRLTSKHFGHHCPTLKHNTGGEVCTMPRRTKSFTTQSSIPQKFETSAQVSEMFAKHRSKPQCHTKCEKHSTGDCVCHVDSADHAMICTMSCEVTKLRKDILDLKVMIANCLMLLEHISSGKDKFVHLKDPDTDEASSGKSLGKRKKGYYCPKKKNSESGQRGDQSQDPPPPGSKKKCYLSRLCKYCCLNF